MLDTVTNTREGVDEDALKKARGVSCVSHLRRHQKYGLGFAIAVIIFIAIMLVVGPRQKLQQRHDGAITTRIAAQDSVAPMPSAPNDLDTMDGENYAHICRQLMLPIHNNVAVKVINLQNNVTVNNTVHPGEYQYYSVCVETHDHHHIVDVYLNLPKYPGGVGTNGQRYDADMYLSSHIAEPKLYDSTWLSAKSGSDHIRLHTDLHDWVQDLKTLHIGVYGRTVSGPVDYSIRAEIRASKTQRHQGGQLADNLRGPHTLQSRNLRYRGRATEP